jgi:hypothetical protein
MYDTLEDRITRLEKNVDFLNKNMFLEPDTLVSSARIDEARKKLKELQFNRLVKDSDFLPKRISDEDKELLVRSGIKILPKLPKKEPTQEEKGGGKGRRTRRLSSQKRRRVLRRTRTKR